MLSKQRRPLKTKLQMALMYSNLPTLQSVNFPFINLGLKLCYRIKVVPILFVLFRFLMGKCAPALFPQTKVAVKLIFIQNQLAKKGGTDFSLHLFLPFFSQKTKQKNFQGFHKTPNSSAILIRRAEKNFSPSKIFQRSPQLSKSAKKEEHLGNISAVSLIKS